MNNEKNQEVNAIDDSLQAIQDNKNQDAEFVNQILFDNAEKMNDDKGYWFKLRGDNRNQFIDAATPLIGMVLRAKTQKAAHQDLENLYKQCVSEIKAIELELIESKYEYSMIIAYRYLLCTFIDEAIMSTKWGSQSQWTSKSLLVHFHNEAWGGEKTYIIIERLEKEVHRYYDILEFIFLCLCLGFEGRFRVMDSVNENHEKVITRLYDALRQHAKREEEALTTPYNNIVNAKYFLKKQLTIKKIALSLCSVMTVIYAIYLFILVTKSDSVVRELKSLL